MAVTFKVPASPKKSVFEIDNFLGVDLTNTGGNIDEVRSPNAENMVRYVPGKVRKRMGYQTQVEFSTGKDVNRAKNTSEDYADCEFDENNVCTYTIYEDKLDNLCLHFFLSCVGEYKLYLDLKNNQSWQFEISATEEEPIIDQSRGAYNWDCTPYDGFYRVRIVKLSDGENDYCQIKGLRICSSTKADNEIDFRKNIAWKAAPEDEGKIYIRTQTNEPIYGCHELQTSNEIGNRVKGANRINGTSSEWTTYTEPQFFYLNEGVPIGTKVTIKFEYQNLVLSQGSSMATVWLANSGRGFSSESGTYEWTYELDHNVSYVKINGFESIDIKSLQFNYQDGEEISEWSISPEDNGEPFPISLVYDVDKSTNYATFTHKMENTVFNTASEFPKYAYLDLPPVYLSSDYLYIEFVLRVETSKTYPTPITSVGYDESYIYGTSFQNVVQLDEGGSGYEDIKYKLVVKNEDISQSGIKVDVGTTLMNSKGECAITVNELQIYPANKRRSFENHKNYYLYHVGHDMYMRCDNDTFATKIFDGMNDHVSKSWQSGSSLYIIDGLTYRKFDYISESMTDVYGTGYIPTVAFSKEPTGGGISKDAFNMLHPGFIDEFLSDGTSTVYQLSVNDLDNIHPRVWVMDDNGDFTELTYGSDFGVNYYEGTVEFTSAPSVSPIEGVDNVRIQAYKTISDYADRINKCTIGTLFGVNGESNRLFLSGNPDHKNWDFFSEMNDFTYFPDTGYSSLGLETSAIVGYSKVNNYLATHKDEFETEQNVLVREGDLIKRTVHVGTEEYEFSDPAFKLINTIQGAGAYGKYTFANLQTEPIFLTKSGLFAITAQDLTGEKYGQNRSFYLNGKLLEEKNLDKAYATVYNDMYILAVNDKLYILDGLQAVQTDKSMPYATRQYVGFYCTNVPANIIFTQDDALWIGTRDGKVCRFNTDVSDLSSYNDDGEPIYCCWETPDLDGRLFYKNKTFRYFAIRMMQAMKTSVKCWYNKNGVWSEHPFKEDSASGIVFDFNNINFELFSFSTDTSEKVVHAKMRVKKVDKARFKVDNGNINEPFGLFNLALEYVESGNYKG